MLARHQLTNIIRVIIHSTLFFLVCGNAQFLNAATLKPINKIVAVVNDEIITQNQVDTGVTRTKQQLQQQLQQQPNAQMPDDKLLRVQVLNQLINQKLELQLAKSNQITTTDAEVDQQVQKIQQAQYLNDDQFNQALASSGLSLSELRQEIHNQLITNQLLQRELGSQVAVTANEVKNFLKLYQSQHPGTEKYYLIDVLFSLPNNVTADQIAQIKQQAQTLVNNAKQNNGDLQKLTVNQSGVQYNDMGWQTKLSLPDIFISQLTYPKVGDIIGPIQAPNGIHVLKVQDLGTSNAQLPAPDLARNYLYQQKMQKAFGPWIGKIRKEADIRILDTQQ